MERTWAAIDGGIVTNTFVGTGEFADLVQADHDQVVEITDLSPAPAVGWTATSDGYRPPPPFPSWVWDVDFWRAPTPPPDGGDYVWHEPTRSWLAVGSANA